MPRIAVVHAVETPAAAKFSMEELVESYFDGFDGQNPSISELGAHVSGTFGTFERQYHCVGFQIKACGGPASEMPFPRVAFFQVFSVYDLCGGSLHVVAEMR